jgi:surface antigen
LGLAFLMALASGGCSFSYQLGSLFEKGKAEDKEEITSSVSAPVDGIMFADLAEGDLAYTRAAVSEVLSRGGKDSSVPWENPSTGARGMVTPIAAGYTENGSVCRDFLASYVRARTETWLQGEACREQQGRWRVRNLRPWKSS